MKTYTATFIGRLKNALGVRYRIETTVTGKDQKAAALNLYERYEHIGSLTLTEQ